MLHLAILTMLFLCIPLYADAVPALKLPFAGGGVWRCDQGNFNDPRGSTNPTHRDNHQGMQYAWDFNWGSGTDDKGKPIVAVASGKVVYAAWANGWGYTVIIDFWDESYGKTCHMLNSTKYPLEVKKGDYVFQGQRIGYCGGTGGNTESNADFFPPHIHYQTQNGPLPGNQSIPSHFSEVCENNGVPLEVHYYVSANYNYSRLHGKVGEYSNGYQKNPNYHVASFQPFSQPFIDLYVSEGSSGPNIYGEPVSYVTQRAPGIYVQEFQHNNERYTMVLNPYVYNDRHYYLGVCYSVNGRIRAFWNPLRDGAPVCNEYYLYRNNKKYVVQWFEVQDEDYKLLAYNLQDNIFFSDAASILGVPQNDVFRDRLRQDKEKNSGGGVGGGGEIITHNTATFTPTQRTTYPTATYTPTVRSIRPVSTPTPKAIQNFTVKTIAVGTGYRDLANWYKEIVDPKDTFLRNETVQVMAELVDITCKIQYRYQLYRNGSLYYSVTEDRMKDNYDHWSVNQFLPRFSWLQTGNYRIEMEIHDGISWQWIGEASFSVTDNNQPQPTATHRLQPSPTTTPTVTPTVTPTPVQQSETAWHSENMTLTSSGELQIRNFKSFLSASARNALENGIPPLLVGNFNPGWSSGIQGILENGTAKFNLVEIQGKLLNGKNRIGIKVGNGWFEIQGNDWQIFYDTSENSIVVGYNINTRSFYAP